MKNLNFIILLLIASLILSSCGRNPLTGKREFSLMSTKQEVALGTSSDPQVVQSFGLYENAELQAYFNAKGQAMAKASHRPEIEYSFKVLDSPVVNAFALPGGYVYFTRGILTHFNNEAEFMGVLGHEIGHIVARHGVKQYSKQMVAQLGLIVGMVVSPTFRQFAGVANQGVGLLLLKFGRDAERQSDEVGVEYSTKQGYDANNMANFFKTLERMSAASGQSIPDFLSTHPNPADRYTTVKELTIKEQQNDSLHTSYKTNRELYLNLINGMVYGEDPRQGYVEDHVFYHPELKMQFDPPRDWNFVNAPTQLQMGPEDGKAFMSMSFAPGSSLSDAANQVIENNKLTVLQSNNVSVNGLNAITMLSEQTSDDGQGQTQTIRILTYIIEYNNAYYLFHGMSLKADFNRYQPKMKSSMKSFKVLTNQAKINKKPTRIKIVKTLKNSTLKQALVAFNSKDSDLEQLAVLNGMLLTDQVKKGTSLKVFTTVNNTLMP